MTSYFSHHSMRGQNHVTFGSGSLNLKGITKWKPVNCVCRVVLCFILFVKWIMDNHVADKWKSEKNKSQSNNQTQESRKSRADMFASCYHYFEGVRLLHLAYGLKMNLFCKYSYVIIFVLQNKFICMKYLHNTPYFI